MSFQCISVDEAKKLIDENNLTIIDIRDYNSFSQGHIAVSYTHLRAHETGAYLVCRLLLEKKKTS